jgi:4-hydroxybenzoate polyprenyltransferase
VKSVGYIENVVVGICFLIVVAWGYHIYASVAGAGAFGNT